MKKSIKNKTVVLTHPVFVVGSYDENGIPNMITISWGGICCSEPPSIAISMRKSRYSYNNIVKNMAFTVNIPPEKYLKEADYVGIYSGRGENKFETTNLTPVKSDVVNAPLIEEFPLNLICKVTHITEIGIHTQFIGEIIQVLADEDILDEDGSPDILKAKPFIYDAASRSYFGISGFLSKAYIQKKKNPNKL